MKTGITGGIGSGKSYVCKLLAQRGIKVYDCDAAAKQLIRTSPRLRQQLKALIGSLDKAAISRFLLANEENQQAVNAIVHPAVHRDFLRWEQEQDAGLVALESAILYESGFHRFMDKVLFVRASEPLRIRRAMERDGASREQIEQRIRMQRAQDFESQADYVIDNEDTSRSDLIFQLEKIVWEIDWYL